MYTNFKLLKRSKMRIALITILFVTLYFISSVVYATGSTEVQEPLTNQYLELKATEVKEGGNGDNQVIMELWGHNITFERI